MAVREQVVRRVLKEKLIQEPETSFLSLRECALRWTHLVDSKTKIAHIDSETDVKNSGVSKNCAVANSDNEEVCAGQPKGTRNFLNHPVPPSGVVKLREEMGQLKECFEQFMNVQLRPNASENYSWQQRITTHFQVGPQAPFAFRERQQRVIRCVMCVKIGHIQSPYVSSDQR